jgi:hypothetical protein
MLVDVAHVSIRHHTPASTSIRQHTSAYLVDVAHSAAAETRRKQLAVLGHLFFRALADTAYAFVVLHASVPCPVSMRQHTSAYRYGIRVRRPPRIRALLSQHVSACVSIRQHTSASTPQLPRISDISSIRQRPSAYVSI